MTCKVTGCSRPVDRKGFCSAHYMRQWRNGTTDKMRKRKGRYEHSGGYWIIYKKDHPISDSNSYVYEHRYVYHEAYGNGPFGCHWCGKLITWDDLHIDHLDDNKKNNKVENLVASCPVCNQRRGRDKQIHTWRKKTGIEYEGKIYGMQELADIRGITRQSLISRLKKMSIDEAMKLPRGKFGPK